MGASVTIGAVGVTIGESVLIGAVGCLVSKGAIGASVIVGATGVSVGGGVIGVSVAAGASVTVGTLVIMILGPSVGVDTGASLGMSDGMSDGTLDGRKRSEGERLGKTDDVLADADGRTVDEERAGAGAVPSFRVHPHKSLSKPGRNPHWSAGMSPFSPAVSNVEHGSVGCEGNSKIASGIPTTNPSPQTLHTLSVLVVGAATTGESTGAGTGAVVTGASEVKLPPEEGDPEAAMGVHPHTSAIKPGSNAHWSSAMIPCAPTACNLEHTTDGCPGTEKIASGFPTSNPSPQTEHPPFAGATGAATAGEFGVELATGEGDAVPGDVVPVEIGDVDPAFGAHPHKSRIKLGSNAH